MASGTVSLGTSGALSGRITWSSTSNGSSKNSSQVTANLQIKRTDSYTTTGTFTYYFDVGGDWTNSEWYGSISSSWTTIASKTITRGHYDDGSGEVYIGGKVNGPTGTTLSGKTVESSQIVALDKIARAATLNSAPNFSDSDKPTITYSNPAGTAATVQIGIFDTKGNTCYVGYRNVSQTGNSYTFTFTDAEIASLRNAVPTGSNTMSVRFYLKTIIGSDSFFSYLTRTLTVKRPATITNAPNFTDEDNPTITYSNPGGNTVDQIQVGIYRTDGQTSIASYRDVPRDKTSYTFELTDQEREKLIAAVPNGSSSTKVRFYIKTYKDGAIIDSPLKVEKTVTIINATPEIECSVKDVGAASTALTKDENSVIRGFNYVTASMTQTLKKGATVNKQTITNGGQTINGASAVFENVENNSFVFSLTDSFGQTVSETVTLNLIPYVSLTCDLYTNNPTADGKMQFKVSGNYFNSKFGDKGVVNELTVLWRIKENNDEYGEWIPASPVAKTDTYEAIVNVTGLNYRSTYTIQAIAKDLVKTSGVLSLEQKVKSLTVFNWGEDNFDINVPLYVDDIIPSNIFYGQLEYGTFNATTGAKSVPTVDIYRCVEPIEVREGTSYIIYIDGNPHREVVLYYDENNNFISQNSEVQNDGIFTTPLGTKYIMFRCFQADYTSAYPSLKIEIRKASPISKTVGKLKDIITVNYNQKLSVTGTTAVQIPFNKVVSQIGNRLTLNSDGSITIGPGVSYVKANLMVWAEAHGSAYSMINLYGNTTKYGVNIFTKVVTDMQAWRTQSIPDTLIPVKEGDVIKATINFSAAHADNKIAGTYASGTNMTVEVIDYAHPGLTYINGDEVRY